MAELHAIERDAARCAEHLALEAVALQRLGAQLGGEDQQALFGVDELIDELGMDVQRLVAGCSPLQL